jgi:hypothetical protein
MVLFALAMSLASQPPTASQPPLQSNLPPPRQSSPAHGDIHEDTDRGNSPEARSALHAYGACLVERNAPVAGGILQMDFTTRGYTDRLNRLMDANPNCFNRAGTRMRFQKLGVAGAMAERLIEREGRALNTRLAQAARNQNAATYSPTDRIALCVVRSVPDQVAALFGSELASPVEIEAARALEPAFNACNQGRTRLSVTTAGARAMLATAAYRSLRAFEAAGGNRD